MFLPSSLFTRMRVRRGSRKSQRQTLLKKTSKGLELTPPRSVERSLSRSKRAASPHLPLTLDEDASPHVGMYLAVVPLLAHTLEGVCIPLSFSQTS